MADLKQIAEAILAKAKLDAHPVGSYYWSALNSPEGAFTGDLPTKNCTDTGGNSANQYYDRLVFKASKTWTGKTSSVGGGAAHNNLPPFVRAYCWRRTA